MTTSSFAPADCEPDQPEHQEDGSQNPQKMYGEPSAEENEHEQQRKKQNHWTSYFRSPEMFGFGLVRRVNATHNISPTIVDDSTASTSVGGQEDK